MNRRSLLGAAGLLGMGIDLSSMRDDILGPSLSEAAEVAAVESGKISAPKFVAAKPVWAEGREREMNLTLKFSAMVELQPNQKAEDYILRMTGSTIAKVTVNGETVGYGPARGPHGWYRIDEWKIGKYLKTGGNTIGVIVAGYNSNSYYLIDQPSFLQAEVVDGAGKVIAATTPNASTFSAHRDNDRIQKVQRYSFQRPFIEVYERPIPDVRVLEIVTLAEQPEVNYLPRRVPYPELTVIEPQKYLQSGTCTRKETLENPWRDRSLVNIGPQLKGYKMEELDLILSDEIQRLETKLHPNAAAKTPEANSVFSAGDVQMVDFGVNLCGFFGFELECDETAKLVLTFDEVATDSGDVDFLRLGTCNAIQWTFKASKQATKNGQKKPETLQLEAFEPQVGRYAKIHCLEGSFKLRKFYLREYAYPHTTGATFACSDARLEKLYRAGVLTFRENSVDAFTDCPHRERAGWLCDSFFTARTAFDLTGKTDVEQVFYENYMLPEKFEFLPDGMLPMCYPADHNDGVYIPNWAMWFVAELAEYSTRSPDRSTIDGLRLRIEKLMKFFEGYENSDGLLEKLPSWVFIEWSAANSFVQDVNYPSNMVYASILDAAGRIYAKPAWIDKAVKIRAKVIEQSYDGEFFVDHAVRKENGALEILRDRTEVCQYFAFFFKTATPESHPELWKRLLDEFGPNRVKDGGWPEIHKANSFVGNVIRLELLSWADRSQQLLDESVAYNEYMADRTGTLWENDGAYASCNHGFASHICHVLYRDVVGIAAVDPIGKELKIRFQKFDALDWAEGKKPLPGDEQVSLRWEKKDGKLVYTLDAPKDYEVTIENATGLMEVAHS